MDSIKHLTQKTNSNISPQKTEEQPASVADVIAVALACGYRWEYVGGNRPLLTNERRSRPEPPPGLPPGHPTTGHWSPIDYAYCAWCQGLRCLHGQQRRYAQAGRNIFCGPDCRDLWRAAEARRRRHAARQAQEVQP